MMQRTLLTLSIWLCLAIPVLGHDPGMSTLVLEATGQGLKVEATFAPQDLDALVAVDANGDGEMTAAEFEAALDPINQWAKSLLELRLGGLLLTASHVQAHLEGDNLSLQLAYSSSSRTQLVVRSKALEHLPGGHRHYLALQDASGKLLAESLLDRNNDSFSYDLAQFEATSEQPASLGRFAVLGIEHILEGYDHLLFLFALLIVCATLAESARIITAFTLAHSITLGLAATQWISLPSGLVEALIAASVVVVGIENLFSRRLGRRWLLAFGFGLVHGLGFASALGGLLGGISGESLMVPVFSFNLGVELGQLALAAAFIPLLRLLRNQPWLEARLVPACSILVIAMGVFWLAERIL